MKISTAKTEVLHHSKNPAQCLLQVNETGREVPVCWVAFTRDGRQGEELDTWIGKASAVLRALYYSIVMKRELSKKASSQFSKQFLSPFSPLVMNPGPAPRGGHSAAMPPNHCLCPPNESCASQARVVLQRKKTGSVAFEMQFDAWDPQNTGHQRRIRDQEPFFRRFCNKDLFFGLHLRIHGILAFAFWSSLSNSRKKVFEPPKSSLSPPVTLLWRRACMNLG